MSISFRECHDSEKFFEILPEDWQEGIVPHWEKYKESSKVFIVESDGEVLGGGIVFSTVSPDTLAYKEEAQRWFDKGYLYIGFLWISEKHRDKKLGTRWLQYLFELFPQQSFWLSIEEYNLVSFYKRSGFQVIKKIISAQSEEWILSREA